MSSLSALLKPCFYFVSLATLLPEVVVENVAYSIWRVKGEKLKVSHCAASYSSAVSWLCATSALGHLVFLPASGLPLVKVRMTCGLTEIEVGRVILIAFAPCLVSVLLLCVLLSWGQAEQQAALLHSPAQPRNDH